MSASIKDILEKLNVLELELKATSSYTEAHGKTIIELNNKIDLLAKSISSTNVSKLAVQPKNNKDSTVTDKRMPNVNVWFKNNFHLYFDKIAKALKLPSDYLNTSKTKYADVLATSKNKDETVLNGLIYKELSVDKSNVATIKAVMKDAFTNINENTTEDMHNSDSEDIHKMNETVTSVSVKKDPVKKEPVKKEPVKKEPVKKEPVKKEPVKKEPVKKEPVKKELVKKELVKQAPISNDSDSEFDDTLERKNGKTEPDSSDESDHSSKVRSNKASFNKRIVPNDSDDDSDNDLQIDDE